ncbi:MAG: hypothetical protein ACU836_11685 [Gammaproteobacteria bacterium]
MSYLKKASIVLLFSVLASAGLIACQNGRKSLEGLPLESQAINATISASFDRNGRLWRLIPTENAVYLQSSADNGQSYSPPVRINQVDREINVWPENPPIVEVGPEGRIHVLYYVNEAQKAESFYSYSDDGGATFSRAVPISDHADSARNYMDGMLADNHGRLYFFWHDTRHENRMKHPGELSLYYAVSDDSGLGRFNNLPVSDNICSCCRTAVGLLPANRPILFARMVFSDGSRDHSLISMKEDGTWATPQRIAYDNWKIDACPEHGPAMSVDRSGRIHMVWFSQGDARQGLFYAHSDNEGKSVSSPIALGNPDYLPSHADVLASNDMVFLAWVEFDGDQSHVWIARSDDRGEHWLAPREVAKASGATNFPKLLNNGKQVFLSWTANKTHQLIAVI